MTSLPTICTASAFGCVREILEDVEEQDFNLAPKIQPRVSPPPRMSPGSSSSASTSPFVPFTSPNKPPRAPRKLSLTMALEEAFLHQNCTLNESDSSSPSTPMTPKTPSFLPAIPASPYSNSSSPSRSPKLSWADVAPAAAAVTSASFFLPKADSLPRVPSMQKSPRTSPKTLRTVQSMSAMAPTLCRCLVEETCVWDERLQTITEHLEENHHLQTTNKTAFSTKVTTADSDEKVQLAMLAKTRWGDLLWFLEREKDPVDLSLNYSVAVYCLDPTARDILARLVMRIGEKKIRWSGDVVKLRKGQRLNHSHRIASGEGVTFQIFGGSDVSVRIDTALELC